MVAVVTPPAIFVPQTFTWGLATKTETFGGRLSSVVRTETQGIPLWVTTLNFPPKEPEAADEIMTFLEDLRGPEGRLYWGHARYLRKGPRGAGGGTPKIQSNSQTGDSVDLDGLPVSTTWAKKGDFVAWNLPGDNRALHRVKTDAVTDSSGQVTVNLTTPMRRSPSNDETVLLAGATGVFRLLDDQQIESEEDIDHFVNISVTLIEAPQPEV